MNQKDIIAKLDRLSELQKVRIQLEQEKKDLIDQILTDEIKRQIADIEEEYYPKLVLSDTDTRDLGSEIEQDVLKFGVTVTGSYLQAVFNPGRTTWDTKGLEQAAKLIPSLIQYRKIGQPYISLKKLPASHKDPLTQGK